MGYRVSVCLCVSVWMGAAMFDGYFPVNVNVRAHGSWRELAAGDRVQDRQARPTPAVNDAIDDTSKSCRPA